MLQAMVMQVLMSFLDSVAKTTSQESTASIKRERERENAYIEACNVADVPSYFQSMAPRSILFADMRRQVDPSGRRPRIEFIPMGPTYTDKSATEHIYDPMGALVSRCFR